MLSASSPFVFPISSPVVQKRATPHEPGSARPNFRSNVPFIVDDDDDDEPEDDTSVAVPCAKKRMLEHHSEHEDKIAEDTRVYQLDESRIEDENIVPSFLGLQNTSNWASQRSIFPDSVIETIAPSSYTAKTCCGTSITVKSRKTSVAISYEAIVAARSRTKEGRAKRSYYGIDVHELIDNASREIANKPPTISAESDVPMLSVEAPAVERGNKKTLLWTEKYRAKHFTDLCGDDTTNRHVLRWLKRWDTIVFPGQAKARPKIAKRHQVEEEKPHRKILMLTGAPGLGKTTLAHVCARQAGYEVLEINASDDRSRDVVRNRIQTSLGTESVKAVSKSKNKDGSQRAAKPICVVVDEVDGVVTGSSASGEGGFVKALMDLVLTDQKNDPAMSGSTSETNHRRKRKGDDFRMLRPLILICNDVYHPSLRPLRQSNMAEVIHVGRPSVDTVVGRLKAVFEREGIPCDKDAARKLCEAAWGMTSGIDAKRGAESTVEGDLRGVMIVGEWAAGRFRSSPRAGSQKLTRSWIESHVLGDLSSSAVGARGLGRGSVREIVQRLFQEGGGFPKTVMDLSGSKTRHEQPQAELGFGEYQKKYAMDRLRQMVDTSGEISTIMTEIFAEYPNREFNDDLYLTKPCQAYDWLHFHDSCQSRLYTSQEWELASYLSQPVLACHHLFASPKKHYADTGAYGRRWTGAAQEGGDDNGQPPLPFSGPRADYQARETEKHNRMQLQALQGQLSPTLTRSFRSPEDVAIEFLPYLIRLVTPDVKPVVIGGSQGSMASVRRESEKAMVQRASQVLAETGVVLQKGKIESETVGGRDSQYVYRMEPDLDALSTFETSTSLSSQTPTRYAVRQVLDQELHKTIALRESQARQARFQAGADASANGAACQAAAAAAANKPADQDRARAAREAKGTRGLVKKDFFGRVIEVKPSGAENDGIESATARARAEDHKVWVTYHEGLNNAVRKPISLQEFLRTL